MTYTIVEGGSAILCLLCGRSSYNPNDVRNAYCGHCHRFHQDQARLAADFIAMAVQTLRPDLDTAEQGVLVTRAMHLIAPKET